MAAPAKGRGATFNPANRFRREQREPVDDGWASAPEDGESEPLLALYRRDCLPAIERALASGRKRAVSFFDAARVRFVGENEWRCWDLDGRSFTNVNTPGDLTVAAAVLHADGAGPGEG